MMKKGEMKEYFFSEESMIEHLDLMELTHE